MTLEEKNSPNLTDSPKARAEFEQWVVKKYQPDVYRHYEKIGRLMPENPARNCVEHHVYCKHFDFQSGVYLAFLREKGIIIHIMPRFAIGKEGLSEFDYYSSVIKWLENKEWRSETISDKFDYNTALIAAIEAGFARLEAA